MPDTPPTPRFSRSLVRCGESLISLGLAKILRGRRRVAARAEPRSMLLVKSCCMGDAVLSLYALREYRRQHPDMRIEALVSARVESVYRDSPHLDQVHVMPITGFRLGQELLRPSLWLHGLRLLRLLQNRRFDLLIDLELYRGYGAALARLLSIPYSHGFDVPGAPRKSHDLLAPRGREEPEWQCFYKVFGLAIPEHAPEPLYALSAERKPSHPPRIGLVFGSSANWPQKRWPLEYFEILGRDLLRRGMQVVLLGSPDERADAARLRSGTPELEDTAGCLDYSGLVKEVSRCSLLIGNDTGTMHVAAAAGIPVLTLFGPTSPKKWNALTSRAIFLEELECRPCYYLGSMPFCSHRNCLWQLSPETVLQIALSELETSLAARISSGAAP